MSSTRRLTPGFYTLTLLYVACSALLYAAVWQPLLTRTHGVARLLLWLKLALELVASFYLFSGLLKAFDYMVGHRGDGGAAGDGRDPAEPERERLGAPDRFWPPAACVYLCAGDLDVRALESLCNLEYPGRLDVFVHDDAGDGAVAAHVDEIARVLAARTGRRLIVLRRPVREGGKPGAVNYVLSHLPEDEAFVLLADNDSTAVDVAALRKAVPLFDDPRVAAVQFRNVGIPGEGDGRVNQVLRKAIEVFDLFAWHQSRHGIPLFFGHNAVLRTAALKRAGGLTPGIFADDIELSIRLMRAGGTILYAPAIRFGETHPASYAAFRKRAYKWAFGCGQIVRGHLLPALRDPRLTFNQKIGLLEFVGFYAMHAALIGYLMLAAVALPVVSGASPGGALAMFLVGAGILAAIFLPSFAYFARRRRLSEWWPFALVCAVVYGSVAFTSARGLLDGVAGRRRRWIPTNLAGGREGVPAATILESAFGLTLFAVPAILAPATLWQPSLYLFAAVFLLSPFVTQLYVPAQRERSLRAFVAAMLGSSGPRSPAVARAGAFAWAHRTMIVSLLAGLVTAPLFLTFHSHASAPTAPRVTIQGDRILVDNRPFQVQGVHYSPWLPGTGPMKNYPWPDASVVDHDLDMIRALGANTILVHDAPRSLLEQARRHDLMVIYAYFINWQSIGDDAAFRRRSEEIARSASDLGREPNLLAIVLGNEVVEWVLKDRGAPFIEKRLRSLHDAVRAVAPLVPLGHANWPVARQLDLSFMDIACFNLYPSWPREVVVAGYGNYIENTLKPIASGRPLLITEFGQNSLEATEEKQAQVLRDCWQEIRARAAGGVVFSFADEWWKNYDNPKVAGEWWQREYAPDDERTHDLDPEEYYGIVTSERAPKPAYAAVREMFAQHDLPVRNLTLYALPLLALVGYTLFVFRRQPRNP